MEMSSRLQNVMLGLRLEMGWPAFKPCNDAIGFTAGRPMDLEVGMEIARFAQLLGKDLIYSGWVSTRAKEPVGFTVAYRELLSVDVVDHVVPWAANDEAPVVLVSTRNDEHFAIDRRGSLVRLKGRPNNIGKGRALAMKRIKSTAANLKGEPLANNRVVPIGAKSIEPDVMPLETVVRFD
jgi:hypothetical protein